MSLGSTMNSSKLISVYSQSPSANLRVTVISANFLMILEIRRTLRHYLDHNLLSCCEWNLLLVQETVTLFMYLCSKGKKVMAQSMSDLGKVTVRKILRQGCLNV